MSESESLLNTEEVDFLLEADGTAGPPADRGIAQEVTMRGDLDQISLSDIFQTLSLAKMEGLLRVRNPLEQRLLHFRGGFVQILVPHRIAARRLGQRLVNAGLLEAEALRAALVAQRKVNKPLGLMLVELGYVTQEQVEEIVGLQATEELIGLFTWRHGTFEFYKGTVSDPKIRARLDKCIEFEVNGLLLEVARRTDEWECILEVLGNLDEYPAMVPAALDAAADLPETERSLAQQVNGTLSYRDLADHAGLSLFDLATQARNLVQRGILRNRSDQDLLGVAKDQLELGQHKRALMTLQTLRDRPGQRDHELVAAMAQLLCQCGAAKAAAALLLDQARRSGDPADALALAAQARAMSARDLEVLTFYRECLLRSASATPAAIEEASLQLLDEYLDRNESDAASALIADCEQAGQPSLQLLTRKTRLQQKQQDVAGAIDTLLAMAELPEVAADRARVTELYEQASKLDRSRRDLQKALRQLRNSRSAVVTRISIVAAVVILVAAGAMVTMWRQASHEAHLAVTAEIGKLLQQGDRAGARRTLLAFAEQHGEGPITADLQRQIEFAEAAEVANQKRLQRKQMLDRLGGAAELMAQAKLAEGLAVYLELHAVPEHQKEVAEVLQLRCETLRDRLEELVKLLAVELPPPPAEVPDRRQVLTGIEKLRALLPAEPVALAEAVMAVETAGGWPAFLPAEIRDKLLRPARLATGQIARVRDRLGVFEDALARVESERRLDPIFKQALEHEQKLQFKEALECYRRLQKEHGGGELQSHFRDQIERFAGICRFTDVIAEATRTGDFVTAQSQLRALRLSYPDIAFEKVVRMPLLVETRPHGATVQWNGTVVGKTPILLSCLPEDEATLDIRLPGFAVEQPKVRGDQTGALNLLLAREPNWQVDLEGIVEQNCASDGRGHVFVTDRAGTVTALDRRTGAVVWRWRSGDLSGYLSAPLLFETTLLVSSLDGPVRAIEQQTGTVRWTTDELPSEVGPVLVGNVLAIATIDRRLVLLNAQTGEKIVAWPLPARISADLVATGDTIVAVCQDGEVAAFDAAKPRTSWRVRLDRASGLRAGAIPGGVVVTAEQGLLCRIDAADGKVVWQTSLEGTVEGLPTHHGSSVLVTLQKRVIRVALDGGQVTGELDAGQDAWSGSALPIGNRILVPMRDGSWRALDSDFQIIWQVKGTRRLSNRATVLPGGELMVGSTDRKILFFDAR